MVYIIVEGKRNPASKEPEARYNSPTKIKTTNNINGGQQLC